MRHQEADRLAGQPAHLHDLSLKRKEVEAAEGQILFPLLDLCISIMFLGIFTSSFGLFQKYKPSI